MMIGHFYPKPALDLLYYTNFCRGGLPKRGTKATGPVTSGWVAPTEIFSRILTGSAKDQDVIEELIQERFLYPYGAPVTKKYLQQLFSRHDPETPFERAVLIALAVTHPLSTLRIRTPQLDCDHAGLSFRKGGLTIRPDVAFQEGRFVGRLRKKQILFLPQHLLNAKPEERAARCLEFSFLLVALLREAGVESGIRISPYHAYAIAAIEGQRYKIDIVADGGPIFEATTEEPDPDTKAIAMHYCDLGGFFFTRRNNSTKALECFELAVTIDPDSAKAWTNLGVIYKDLDRYKEVVPAYIRALELEPTFYMAFENLLKVMQWGEEAIKAAIVENLSRIIELAERGSSLAPDNLGILFCLGNFYCAQGNFTKGIEIFDASLRLNPNQTEVKTCRARALATLAEIKKESDAP